MKLGIICQIASSGGWNYVYLLSGHLKKNYPDWEITIFYNDDSILDLFDYRNKLQDNGIKLVSMPKTSSKKRKGLKKLFYKLKKYIRKKSYKKLYAELEKCDVLFYAWPYGINVFPVNKPTFFIPHDFIYTHWFGFHCGNVYNQDNYRATYEKHAEFCKVGTPIVSTDYIANEFKNTFPDANKAPKVIYLSRFNDFSKSNQNEVENYLKQKGITFPYLLWPSNWMYHKNISPLLGAFYEVKQKYPDIKLILTGHNTGNLKVICRSPFYCNHLNDKDTEWDVWGLGELPAEEFKLILQGATAVLNTSLCEAGAGSALDAWSMGVPMIMSDIPPFREQVTYLKTYADFFDPRNSHDIANAIFRVLDNPKEAKKKAKESETALSHYTWDDVAKQYAKVFMEAFDEQK